MLTHKKEPKSNGFALIKQAEPEPKNIFSEILIDIH